MLITYYKTKRIIIRRIIIRIREKSRHKTKRIILLFLVISKKSMHALYL